MRPEEKTRAQEGKHQTDGRPPVLPLADRPRCSLDCLLLRLPTSSPPPCCLRRFPVVVCASLSHLALRFWLSMVWFSIRTRTTAWILSRSCTCRRDMNADPFGRQSRGANVCSAVAAGLWDRRAFVAAANGGRGVAAFHWREGRREWSSVCMRRTSRP